MRPGEAPGELPGKKSVKGNLQTPAAPSATNLSPCVLVADGRIMARPAGYFGNEESAAASGRGRLHRGGGTTAAPNMASGSAMNDPSSQLAGLFGGERRLGLFGRCPPDTSGRDVRRSHTPAAPGAKPPAGQPPVAEEAVAAEFVVPVPRPWPKGRRWAACPT